MAILVIETGSMHGVGPVEGGRHARYAAGEWLLKDQPRAGQDDAAVIGGFLLSLPQFVSRGR